MSKVDLTISEDSFLKFKKEAIDNANEVYGEWDRGDLLCFNDLKLDINSL